MVRKRKKPKRQPSVEIALTEEIADTALKAADLKERLLLRRVHFEKYNQKARENLERVKTLHISVLSIEDPSERARALSAVQVLEKKIRDSLFVLAKARSMVRRYTQIVEGYARRIARCQGILAQRLHE